MTSSKQSPRRERSSASWPRTIWTKNPVLACDSASGSTFPLGTTKVTNCVATDAAGNERHGDFDVKVVDTTAPVLNQHQDVIENQQSSHGAVVNYALPGATDAVDPNPNVSCSPDSGSTFPIGSTTVTCQASDNDGNHSQSQFSVVVQQGPAPDPPTITAHVPPLTNKTSAHFEFSADSGVGLDCRLTGPGATDTFVPCVNDTSQSYTGLQEGAYGFTVQATNGIGNISQKSFSWTIDRTKPAAVTKFHALRGPRSCGSNGSSRSMWTTTTCGSCGSGWEPSSGRRSQHATQLRPSRTPPSRTTCATAIGSRASIRRGTRRPVPSERPSEQDLLARLRRDPSIAAADRLDSSEECDVLQRPGVAQRTKGLEPLAPPLIHQLGLAGRSPDGRSRSLPVTTWSTPGQGLEGERRPTTGGCWDGPRSRFASRPRES